MAEAISAADALDVPVLIVPVLIVSGYDETIGIAADVARMTKPFRKADLAPSLNALLPSNPAR